MRWKWAIFYEVGVNVYRMESLEEYDLTTNAIRHLDWLIENGHLKLPKGAKILGRFVYEVNYV